MLEFNDIQSGVLRPRPTPYAGTYIMLRIDDRAAGHQLLKRLTPAIASATDLTSPAGDAWVAVALSSHGLKALGVPQASLESFSPEFQRKVWSEKIAFMRLNIDPAELLAVGPATVVPDNIGFKRAQ